MKGNTRLNIGAINIYYLRTKPTWQCATFTMLDFNSFMLSPLV